MKAGTMLRLGSFWVGVHHSDKNKRTCINLLPCWTIWITTEGGTPPYNKPLQLMSLLTRLKRQLRIFFRTIPYWKLWHRNNYSLFLDDMRVPKDVFRFNGDDDYKGHKWIVVRNYNEFVKHIDKSFKKGKLPKIISFDHDLGLEHTKYYFENGGHKNPPDPLKGNFTEKHGYDCCKWLVEYCMDNKMELPAYKVHSANPVGKVNIESYLFNYNKHSKK